MKKETFKIFGYNSKENRYFTKERTGYIVEINGIQYGLEKLTRFWQATEITTGMQVTNAVTKEELIEKLERFNPNTIKYVIACNLKKYPEIAEMMK